MKVFTNFISVSGVNFTVGFGDILYNSLTPEEANCLHVCSRVLGEVIGYYALLFDCYHQHPSGRFVYMVGNAYNDVGIFVKELQVYAEELQGDSSECK